MRRKHGKTADIAVAAAESLSAPQVTALQRIILGDAMAAVAEAAGVDRATLYRWRTQDPAFQSALAAWRSEQVTASHDRLSGLASAATDAVAKAIHDGDARLAFRLLEGMRAVAPPPPPDIGKAMVRPAGFNGELATVYAFSVKITFPGIADEKVVSCLMSRLELSENDAWRYAYTSQLTPPTLERRNADSLAEILSELGASCEVVSMTVLKPREQYPVPRRYGDPPWMAHESKVAGAAEARDRISKRRTLVLAAQERQRDATMSDARDPGAGGAMADAASSIAVDGAD